MSRQSDIIGRLAPAGRVAVIRLRSLGDCVLSTPAIRLLKEFRPDLRIAVVAEDRFRDVFVGNPDVSDVLPASIRALRAFDPSLCLNLHGGSRSARLTLLSGATHRAGFDIFRPAWAYNAAIPRAQETLDVTRRVHTAEHMASAVFWLGVPIAEVPRAHVPAAAGRSEYAPNEPYAVVHPLAALPEKTWPHFAALGKFLRERLGLRPVFIGGPGDDLSAFDGEDTVAGAPLGEAARLIRDAALFVGNDSGPAHIAASFGIPVGVFFGPSDSEIWYPWRTRAEVLKADGPIERITLDEAREAVLRLVA